MVDFSNIRDSEKIMNTLWALHRIGRMRATEFSPIEVNNFILRVVARDGYQTNNKFGWIPQELEKLPRIPELKDVKISIYKKETNNNFYSSVIISKDNVFKNIEWKSKFHDNTNYGIVTAEDLVVIIRYLQVVDEFAAFT